MPNRLAHETSPYLLQHKDNPVDWYPWGEEALARAREEDRPILLSIGYSACHWCHVMERESFEDARPRALMNERFVCIKLDREERPDLDSIYMEACQAMTGHGGWPLNVFLTPEQVPFYAGTYFPPEPRHGHAELAPGARGRGRRPGRSRRDEIRAGGARIAERLRGGALLQPSREPVRRSERLDDGGARACATRYDRRQRRLRRRAQVPARLGARVPPAPRRGGDAAPHAARDGARRHVRPGRRRVRPLLGRRALARAPLREDALRQRAARARLPARLAGDRRRRCSGAVCEETLDWALREMRGPEGGFFSALDADSEGVEGKFYVWSLEELRAASGRATPTRRSPGSAPPSAATSRAEHPRARPGRAGASCDDWRRSLYEARSQRVWPGLDDKRLTSWNALMISALAEAGAVLERPDYLEAAARVRGASCWASCATPTAACCAPGRTARPSSTPTWRTTPSCSRRLLTLYEASFDPRWFAAARELADAMIERFADDEPAASSRPRPTTSSCVARRKDLEDHPIPSGNASAASACCAWPR